MSSVTDNPLKPRLFLSPPHMGATELSFIEEAFRTNFIAPVGPNVDAFEREFASRFGFKHAAEALGSTFAGKAAGSFGRMGIFSFNGNKIITTSGGGMLVSDDGDLIAQARFLATQARDAAQHYQHSQTGFNYRMSNVLAGI